MSTGFTPTHRLVGVPRKLDDAGRAKHPQKSWSIGMYGPDEHELLCRVAAKLARSDARAGHRIPRGGLSFRAATRRALEELERRLDAGDPPPDPAR